MVKINPQVKLSADGELYPQAVAALSECLTSIPNATITINQNVLLSLDKQPDFIAEATVAGRHITLIAELKKSGEPQFARYAINQIHAYRRGLSLTKAIGVFIAPYISETTAKLCRDENIGYLDLAGNCHIEFHSVYIHIEGKPNPFFRYRSLLSLYQPKAERVLRVLLTHPSKPWRIQALANEAQVSVGQVHKVKERLLEKEWLVETDQGIKLATPQELLAAWAGNYRMNKHQGAQFYTLTNLEAFEQGLSIGCRQRDIPYAFTSFAAAARYAPYAAYQRTTAYVHYQTAEVQELLDHPLLQLSPVETGANVILLSPYDDGVFYGTRQPSEISLASPLQTYLDLQSAGGRGREAAEFLLQKEIAPHW